MHASVPAETMQTAAAESAAYENARRHTALETGLPLAVLPETCPFSVDVVEFWA